MYAHNIPLVDAHGIPLVDALGIPLVDAHGVYRIYRNLTINVKWSHMHYRLNHVILFFIFE